MSELISPRYRDMQAALHATGQYGTMGALYGRLLGQLLDRINAGSLLDYGCGSRRSLLETLKLSESVVYEGYDPAVPQYADRPAPADLVCCIDVLEHIEPELLDNVLDDLCELCDPFGFFTVHTGPARKVLLDGRNAHLTQEGIAWWVPRFSSRIGIAGLFSLPAGFCLFVHRRDDDRVNNSILDACNRCIAAHLPPLWGAAS